MRGAVDKMEFPGTDPEVRARLEEELTLRGPGAPCTPAWPPPTPRPLARSCRATAAGSSGPSR
ncbi:hypothetical protein GCM10011428_37510 [Streptomyces violaceus]